MTNGKRKGKDGELELAELLRDHGWPDARRGVQYRGGADAPDIVGGPRRLHVEGKRVEAGNPYVWLDQAKRDAAADRVPTVFHRRSRREWIVILPADAFLNMMRELETKEELLNAL